MLTKKLLICAGSLVLAQLLAGCGVCEDCPCEGKVGALDPSAGSTKGRVGDPCDDKSDCASFEGAEPVCVHTTAGLPSLVTWPEGYCSFVCIYKTQKCPTGTTCSNYGALGLSDPNLCVLGCLTNEDCRANYVCDYGSCIPNF